MKAAGLIDKPDTHEGTDTFPGILGAEKGERKTSGVQNVPARLSIKERNLQIRRRGCSFANIRPKPHAG